jgi:tetratricopeptide (TPR) repeat protein
MTNKNNFKNLYRLFAVSILFFAAVTGLGNGVFVIADDGVIVTGGNEAMGDAVEYNKQGEEHRIKGEYLKALEFYRKALAVLDTSDNKNTPDAAAVYNNIGLATMELGGLDKALEWQQKALAVREKELGEEHLDTAQSYNNIGLTYRKKGNYEKAEEFYQKALAIREKVLGKDHPDTANSYNNTAVLYYQQKKYQESLDLLLKAYQIRSAKLGEKDVDTKTSLTNLKTVYGLLRKEQPFEEWLKEQVKQPEETTKEQQETEQREMEKPDAAAALIDNGRNFLKQDKFDEALAEFLKALEIREKEGNENPTVAEVSCNVGMIYYLQEEKDKAIEYFLKAAGIREKVLGKTHPDTADTYHTIGTFYERTGDLKKSLEFHTKTFFTRKMLLEEYHRKHNDAPTVNNPELGQLEFQFAKEHVNLGGLFGKLNQHGMAYHFYLTAHLIYEGVNSDGAMSDPKYQFKNDQLDKALANTKIHYEKDDDPGNEESFDEIIKDGGVGELAERIFLGETMQFFEEELEKEFLQGKQSELLKDMFDTGKAKGKTKTKVE